MSRSTFALFIGVFSVALYLFLTIFLVFFTVGFNTGLEEAVADENTSEETQAIVAVTAVAFNGFSFAMLAVFIVMLIASILMVYGVKKERHQYIAPWVILAAIAVVIKLVVVFFKLADPESDTFTYVVSAVISAAVWYPIFSYYQSLKHPQAVAVPCSPCSPVSCEAPVQACATPSDYSHANAKYVPTACVAAPPHSQVVYPSVPVCKV